MKNNILPSCLGLFDILVEEKDNKKIIKIILASGSEKPYYLKSKGMSPKGCFIRIGSACQSMETRLIEEYFSRRTRNNLGRIASNKQNLSFEQLKIYYQESEHPLNENFASNLELLTKEKSYNYIAYLLADKNGNSVQVAKYAEVNRVDLIESNEYGYCCLIKATKRVLDKLQLENKTQTKITSKERKETRLWDAVALREAIINAFVHNDYSSENPPKFEIFSDRLEITSNGGLPYELDQEEFFSGYSVPRNKEIMRVYKDLDLVEQLGSGISRILDHYPREVFKFSKNFLRVILPIEKSIEDKKITKKGGREITKKGGVEIIQKGGQEITKKGGVKTRFKEGGIFIQKGGREITKEGGVEIIQKGGREISKKGGVKIDKKGEVIFFFSQRQKEILKLIKTKPEISYIKLAETLKINSSAVQKNLHSLKSNKIIKRIQRDKKSFWTIINEGIINLTQRQEEVLKLIYNNPKRTREQLSKILNIHSSAVQKHLNKLKNKKLIQRIGSNKTGYWKVNN